jgi:PilZ domain-containing protein
MAEERRKNPRYVVDVPVRLMAGGVMTQGRLRDICRDAALVEVDAPQALESTVTLLLELPGTGGPLRVVGRVIRLAAAGEGRHGAAVLFTEVPPATEARIDFFVALQEGKA